MSDNAKVKFLVDGQEIELPEEMLHFLLVVRNGALKYGMDNWLEPNGVRSDEKSMHDSMFHHLAESYAGIRQDKDSKLDPLLHLSCRALMLYTRRQKRIVHDLDKEKYIL